MGTLYNLLHGKNPMSGVLLHMLGIDQKGERWRSGRFRDIYLNATGTEIVLYTRNGGGNREHNEPESEPGPECHCTGCTATYHLPSHPNYLRDWDDDFDRTYAYFAFSVPEEFKALADFLKPGEDPKSVGERFQKTLAEMKAMPAEQLEQDPRFKPMVEFVNKIAKAVREESNG